MHSLKSLFWNVLCDKVHLWLRQLKFDTMIATPLRTISISKKNLWFSGIHDKKAKHIEPIEQMQWSRTLVSPSSSLFFSFWIFFLHSCNFVIVHIWIYPSKLWHIFILFYFDHQYRLCIVVQKQRTKYVILKSMETLIYFKHLLIINGVLSPLFHRQIHKTVFYLISHANSMDICRHICHIQWTIQSQL